MLEQTDHYTVTADFSTPVIAAAIHAGHRIRNGLLEKMRVEEEVRLREEDPFTDVMIEGFANRVVVRTSRFEADFNRARDKAIYFRPEDAWGIDVWKHPPSSAEIEAVLAVYDSFYRKVGEVVAETIDRHGRFALIDVHSYCHRRNGPEAPPAPDPENPDVNLGTESIDPKWRREIDRFGQAFRNPDFTGRRLDVRENVKFKGGFFPRWANARFGDKGFAVAVEFKKFFMDEWTGEPLDETVAELARALQCAGEAIWSEE